MGFSVSRAPLSESHKQAIRQALYGKKLSFTTRTKTSLTRQGKPLSELRKTALGGRSLSIESRQKISQTKKGKKKH